ncbi:MAG: NADPH:quinone oxidoreductase family protein [Myxococcota bacterium]
MRAIVVDRWMEPGELELRECPEPTLTDGGVRVDVKAAGCNFFDILLVQGRYQVKPPFPFVPGAELAGVVCSTGEGVESFSVGDPVYGSVPFGAFAERAVVPAGMLRRLPEGMSFEEAAGLPIVYPTSYAGLVHRAALRRGETLLVHAAAGGVGIAAVQIGKALGARVLATAGGPEKLAVAREAGADEVLDYRQDDWVDAVRDATGGRGADVIYDPVGGDVFDRSLKCIAWNGRLLVIGFASGRIPELRVNRVLLKNISIVGLHWGAYAVHEPARVPETFDALDRLYAEGRIQPMVFKCYPLAEASQALEALASRATWGKVVVTP